MRRHAGAEWTVFAGISESVVLTLVPLSVKAAMAFVAENHRHHPRVVGGLFAVGLADNSQLVGVAIVGRPVARMIAGDTAEVTRLCSLGTKNACSMLYNACARAAKALGYRKIITYTLESESGASLKAAGWALVGRAGGGTWSRGSRPRIDKHPTEGKFKWERELV